jgi:hypothetical protein
VTAPLVDPALVPLSSAGSSPLVRRPVVRRVPRLEPPYDDELAEAQLQLVPQLEELPFEEPAPRRLEHEIDFFDPQPTPRRDLPDPERWATRFLQAVLETMAGCRASAQLHEWTSPAVHAQVVGSAQARRGITSARALPLVRSVHVGEPADGVAEVCAVVQRGHRFAAVAARLEGFDGRWRCVALELR